MEEQLHRYFQAQFPAARSVDIRSFRVIAGGYSRETFACDAIVEHDGGRVEELRLILRRDPPPESAILDTSRLVEHHLLNRLAAETAIPVPRSLFLDEAGVAFERPAMLIERLSGNSDLSALFGGADSDQLESVATELCEQLAALHNTAVPLLDPEGALRDPRGVGIDTTDGQAYLDSMLAYFSRSYSELAFDTLPVYYDAFTSLRNHMPAPAPRLVVCHGDFQASNFLYDNGRVTGVIDWENAHIGDPREELGWLYHMQLIMQLDIMGAVKADGGFLGHYSKLTGIPVTMDDVRFFQLFTASALAIPILAAVGRRLAGKGTEFLHVYMQQPLVASMGIFAAILGYPPAEGEA